MNEHKNIITIEDEIKEFSDKPVKSAALYKKVKELESSAVPDYSSASNGDVLTKGSGGIGWATPSGGGGCLAVHDSEEGANTVLDQTWQAISDAVVSGKMVILISSQPENGATPISPGATYIRPLAIVYEDTDYKVLFGETDEYYSSTASGYPKRIF